MSHRAGDPERTETGLSLEALAAVDEKGGDAVAEPVQGSVGHPGLVTDRTEAVIEDADREPASVTGVGGDPDHEQVLLGGLEEAS